MGRGGGGAQGCRYTKGILQKEKERKGWNLGLLHRVEFWKYGHPRFFPRLTTIGWLVVLNWEKLEAGVWEEYSKILENESKKALSFL